MKVKTFYQRNNGYYYAVFSLKDKDKKVSLKTKDIQQAKANLNEILNEYDKEMKIIKRKKKIKEGELSFAFKHYLNNKNDLQASTIESVKYSIRKLNRYLSGREISKVYEITEHSLKMFIELLKEEHRSIKTMNNYIIIINDFFHFCKEKNYTIKMIQLDHLKKHYPVQRVNIMNESDADILLKELQNISNSVVRTAIIMPLYTGMRYSEIKGLNRKNIFLEEKYTEIKKNYIYICEKMTDKNDVPVKRMKSYFAKRKVYLIDNIAAILKDFLANNDGEYPFIGIKSSAIKYYKKQIKQKINIDINFNHERHFFASLLIDAGFNILEIQKMMGHSSAKTTLDTYGHLINDIDFSKFENIEFFKM